MVIKPLRRHDPIQLFLCQHLGGTFIDARDAIAGGHFASQLRAQFREGDDFTFSR
jgi:hypothetical protein